MLIGFIRRYHVADGGAAIGGTTGQGAATGGEPGAQTPAASSPGQVPAPASGVVVPPAPTAPATPPASSTSTTDDRAFSQADVDRIVSERLAEEKRRNDARTADAAKKTKEEALRQAGEWQTLAEQRGTELATLQGATERADLLAKALNDVIKEQIADWPDEVKALDPGKDNVEARIAWMKSARPLADRLRAAPKAPTTEAGAGNRPPATPNDNGRPNDKKYRFQQPGDVTW